jgi:prepilin-type N-terminal cleavage/methylation domain-containing protein
MKKATLSLSNRVKNSSSTNNKPYSRTNSRSNTFSLSKGFTIVELLVVIVVIAILAAITIVSYTGISSKATASALQSDLSNAKKQLEIYQVDNSSYPLSLDCSSTPAANTICLKTSSGNSLIYSGATTNYYLKATNGSTNFQATASTAPTDTASLTCPTGYIPVPGSATYGTSNFCVMKYEAKNVGGVATSQAASTPWVSITQTISISTAAAACTGCHLITEAEWLTIDQNVLNVPSNWSSGTVGTGYIFSGHNDNAPANALAVSNTADSYSDTGNSSGSGANQKRTLTLSNGEVIWDLAGNVWEWTSGTVQSPTVQPGINGGGLALREWTAVTNPGTISPSPSPAGTGIAGASGWNTSYGIGVVYSSADETGLRGFLRGGSWIEGGGAGVLILALHAHPSYPGTSLGFRVAAP